MASVETPGPDVRRTIPIWMKALLVASLAVNLLVAGLVAGAFWRGRPAMMMNAATNGGASLAGYVATLPNDRRRELWTKAQPSRDEIAGLRRDIRQARQDALKSLTAEPFDKQRYIDAQTRLLDAEVRQRTFQRKVSAELAASMSAEERKSFLHWRPAQGRGRGGPEDADTGAEPKKP